MTGVRKAGGINASIIFVVCIILRISSENWKKRVAVYDVPLQKSIVFCIISLKFSIFFSVSAHSRE